MSTKDWILLLVPILFDGIIMFVLQKVFEKRQLIFIEKYRYVSILQQKVDDALASFTKVLQTSDNESEQISYLNDFAKCYCDVFYYYQQNKKLLKHLEKHIDELISTHEQIKSNQFKENSNEYIASLFRRIYEILQSIQNDCINHKI